MRPLVVSEHPPTICEAISKVLLQVKGFFSLLKSSTKVPGFCTSLKTMCPPGCNKMWIVAIVDARCMVAWITFVAKMAVISWLLKPSEETKGSSG